MRVSEFCGLTVNDLDFENKRIRVDHQILRDNKGRYYIEKTKTESGRCFIPMTNDVLEVLKNILKKRLRMKKELLIDGYSGFLLVDKNRNPKVALHILGAVEDVVIAIFVMLSRILLIEFDKWNYVVKEKIGIAGGWHILCRLRAMKERGESIDWW